MTGSRPCSSPTPRCCGCWPRSSLPAASRSGRSSSSAPPKCSPMPPVGWRRTPGARPPFNVYGATETSGIVADCGHHTGMHLFEDLVITEVVDDDNRPVPPGEYGVKVLVSVLFSRTLPLVRYEMSDSLQLAAGSHDCSCGRPYALLAGIQGRQQEALSFATSNGPTRTVQPLVFHHVMDGVTAAGWQVKQHPDGRLEVLVAQPQGLDGAALVAALRSALVGQGVQPPPIQVQEVPAIPRTALGKAPLIIRT